MRKDIEDLLSMVADGILDLADLLAMAWERLVTPLSLLRLVIVGIVIAVLLW
jgi:hypothetical protein